MDISWLVATSQCSVLSDCGGVAAAFWFLVCCFVSLEIEFALLRYWLLAASAFECMFECSVFSIEFF